MGTEFSSGLSSATDWLETSISADQEGFAMLGTCSGYSIGIQPIFTDGFVGGNSGCSSSGPGGAGWQNNQPPATNPNQFYVLSLQTIGGNAYTYSNYTPITNNGGNAASGNSAAYQHATNAYYHWMRERVPPSNNIMPRVTYLGAQSTVTPPSLSKPVISNAIVDVGQTETITATITGGTANYIGNALISNSVGINQRIAVASQSSNSLSESWTVAANEIGTETGNFVLTDAEPVAFNSIPSNSFTVNQAPSISSSPGTQTYDLGSTITQTATIVGGTSQFTYNQIIYSSGTPVFVSNSPFTSSTTNTISLLASSLGAPGTYTYNVIARDSAPAGGVTFNTVTYTLTVDTALNVGTPTPTNPFIDNGQSILLTTATATGGSGGYTYQWSTHSDCSSPYASGTTNTVSPTSNTFYYVQVTDSLGFTACSSPGANVIVNAAPSITSSPGTQTYAYGTPITQTATIVGGTSQFSYNQIIYSTNTLSLHLQM